MNKPQAIADNTANSAAWDRWTLSHINAIALGAVALGFVLRVREAWGTFLNPDEALHFFIANRASLHAVYHASLTQAHPPLLFFLLYALRPFGNSEFILRLPSVFAGGLFCWIFFKWLTRILGPVPGISGLIFATLLPPMINVTAQVRQYGLLLVFLISGAWFLECALEKDSPGLMLISAASLWLAMLSHYSAFFFIAAIGLYAILRILSCETSTSTAITWVAGQIVIVALAVSFYVTHISRIKGTSMAEQAFDGWLRKSYFHQGSDNVLTFLLTRSFSLFQYSFGQLVVGDIVALLFLAGIVFLLGNKLRSTGTRYERAVIFVFPFLLNYAAALRDLYPYGGTRHCVYLTIFALAVVSACISKVTRESAVRAIAIAILIVTLCSIFRTNHAPYIARMDQSRNNMLHAVTFAREQISDSDPIFVDYESGIELGHYLCEQEAVTYDGSIPGFLVFHCGGHRIISTIPDVWAFTPTVFLQEFSRLVRVADLKPGQVVWVAEAGWMVKLDDELRKYSELHDLQTQAFGNNLRFLKLLAGQSMPIATSDVIEHDER